MKPFRFSILHRRALNLVGLITLSFGSASGADLYWDGRSGTTTVTSWNDVNGWSTVAAGGTNPAAIPGIGDAVVFRANDIKDGALTITMNGVLPIQGIKTLFSGGVYSQNATTTIAGTSGSTNVLQVWGIPTAISGKTIGLDHAAGGITLGTAALPVNITIHSPHQTWNSNVVGGTAPGAAALIVNGSISGGITGDVTLSLAGQNTGTTLNGSISNGIATNFNVEVVGSTNAIWTLTAPNYYNGTTKINAGTLRLARADSLGAGAVTVASGATLALRVGPNTFTAAEISAIGNRVIFGSNTAILALDTTNSAAEVDGGLSGAGTYRKIGANSLVLTGPNTYTGTTGFQINEGNVAIRRPTGVFAGTGAGAGKAVVGSNSALLAIMGPNGFSENELSLLPGLTTVPATANVGISTIDGDYTLSGGLFGSRPQWYKGDTGTLTLVGNRTDTSNVIVTGGTLRVLSLPATAGTSPIGLYTDATTSPADSHQLQLNGGRFMYAGPGLSTDRPVAMAGNGILDSSGSGALVLTAAAQPHNGTTARTLTLTGYAPGENKITGAITNADTGVLSLTKQGSASWTLAGTNTYTGITRNNGGLLTLDYTAGGNPISTGAVHLNAGEIRVKGTTAGTTETFSAFQVQSGAHTFGSLTLDGRVNLTITTLGNGGQAQRADLIDISSNPANSITVTNALASNAATQVVNGVLMVNTGASVDNGRANIILRDKDGTYGFPTLSGTTNGTLIKATTVAPTVTASKVVLNNLAANYILKTGAHSLQPSPAPAPVFQTLTLDSQAATVSTSNEVSLFLDAQVLSPSKSGRGILLVGNNNIKISNGNTNSANQPIWFHNYLQPSATFTLKADFNQQYLIFAGTGFTDYQGYGYADNFFVLGSVVRLSQEQQVAEEVGNFRVAAGGVLELGAKFYSAPFTVPASWKDVDFVKPVRSAAIGSGGIAFYGDAGLGAYSSTPTTITKRVVHFSNGSVQNPVSQPLVWGAARFLTQPDSDTDGDYSLKLSSLKSNVTLELRNGIDLNGRSRNVDVAQGSANIDGLLSGVISGSDASGLIKSGAGTLQLTGQNTYKGETRVQDGTLMVAAGSLHPSSTVSIITPASGGTGKLNVTGVVTVAGVSIDGIPQLPGRVQNPTIITGTGELWVDVLSPYQQWATNAGLASGENGGDIDADFDGAKNLIEYAVGTNPKQSTPSVLTKLPGSATAVRFNRATSPARTDLNLYLESSETLSGTWTVIATSTAGATMVTSAGASVTVSETAGQVTVTDNRTPAPVKVFYRLRGEIP